MNVSTFLENSIAIIWGKFSENLPQGNRIERVVKNLSKKTLIGMIHATKRNIFSIAI